MKIIEPSYTVEYMPDYQHTLKKVEHFARNCYKSEGQIDDGTDICPQYIGGRCKEDPCQVCNGSRRVTIRESSAIKLIRKRLLRIDELNEVRQCLFKGGCGKYVPSVSFHDTHEGPLEHEIISVRFVCDRGVSHELVRHRIASFLQESTRYCCYGDDKKGLVLINPPFWPTVSMDESIKMPLCGDERRYIEWYKAMKDAGDHYGALISMGAKPEEARSVLPHSTKVDIIETANLREWRFILKLRTSPKAHPQMRQLTIPLLKELKQKMPVFFEDIWEESMSARYKDMTGYQELLASVQGTAKLALDNWGDLQGHEGVRYLVQGFNNIIDMIKKAA